MNEWNAILCVCLVFGAMFAMTIYRKKQNEMERPEFSWKHYTKPTPKNLLGLATSMRRLVAVAAGTTLIMESSMYVTLTIIIAGAVLDELKNFFAMVDDDIKTESVTAEFPSGEEVTVTHEKPKDENQ